MWSEKCNRYATQQALSRALLPALQKMSALHWHSSLENSRTVVHTSARGGEPACLHLFTEQSMNKACYSDSFAGEKYVAQRVQYTNGSISLQHGQKETLFLNEATCSYHSNDLDRIDNWGLKHVSHCPENYMRSDKSRRPRQASKSARMVISI